MNRRDFLTRAHAVAAAAIVHPESIGTPRTPESDSDVPRAVDCRKDQNCFDIEVRRFGAKVEHCVAYDLDAQTVTRYRLMPDGRIAAAYGDEVATVTEQGGVSVHWMPKRR